MHKFLTILTLLTIFIVACVPLTPPSSLRQQELAATETADAQATQQTAATQAAYATAWDLTVALSQTLATQQYADWKLKHDAQIAQVTLDAADLATTRSHLATQSVLSTATAVYGGTATADSDRAATQTAIENAVRTRATADGIGLIIQTIAWLIVVALAVWVITFGIEHWRAADERIEAMRHTADAELARLKAEHEIQLQRERLLAEIAIARERIQAEQGRLYQLESGATVQLGHDFVWRPMLGLQPAEKQVVIETSPHADELGQFLAKCLDTVKGDMFCRYIPSAEALNMSPGTRDSHVERLKATGWVTTKTGRPLGGQLSNTVIRLGHNLGDLIAAHNACELTVEKVEIVN